MKKTFYLLLISSILFTSCNDKYDGPLYKIRIEHTAPGGNAIDTLIVGTPTYDATRYKITTPRGFINIENVRSFTVLKQIPTKWNDEKLAKEYYDKQYDDTHKSETRDKRWWEKDHKDPWEESK